ncbi:permease prefix domain 1-containing protein [Anatilimnocola floriformis]|uniref:permease prefix domain 1-containing protein n=1 Tax=Anatilimnocola floriformis TaxID=2948575 RepID=UPI0020C562E5|nr:permease prefix domain 1-containing protein [Anatilimnocola floriformis]
MNPHEFDNYLTLLTSLLRIRGEQRDVIAQELRAHLEDRLDDLLARGVDRDTAVRMALEDFGDAAGLAANFSLLVRNRRRRWFVKVTSYSTAVLVLLALGVIAIWPERRPGPAPPQAQAQAVAKNGPQIPEQGPTKPTADNSLSDKLALRVTAEFSQTPLEDVLAFLADTSDVQMFINRKALESEGLELSAPITINLKKVRLDMLLELVLEQASTNGSLAYVERDGILIVSTSTNLEGASEVRVYNCRDLLNFEEPRGPRAMPGMGMPPIGGGAGGIMLPGPGPGGPPGAVPGMPGGMGPMGGGGFGGGEDKPLTEAQQRAESLKQLLQTAVKPSSWSEVGGIGTISEYNGLIVINHDAKTHKQVENVLKMLREAAGLEPGKTAKIPKQ